MSNADWGIGEVRVIICLRFVGADIRVTPFFYHRNQLRHLTKEVGRDGSTEYGIYSGVQRGHWTVFE